MATLAKKTGRTNSITGIKVDALNAEAMAKYIKKAKIEIDTGEEPEQVAVSLYAHFQSEFEPDDLAMCEVCNGAAPETESDCPYCGTEGEVEDVADEPKSKSKKTKVEAEEEEDEEEEDEEEEEEEEEEPVVKKASASSKKAASKKTEKAEKTEKTEKKSEGSNLVHLKGRGTSMVKASTLDAAVEELFRLKSDMLTNVLSFGRKLIEVVDQQLWKLRLDEEGKQRYASFDAFVHHELKMTPAHAANHIRTARHYTDEDIAQLTQSKATFILQAPPEDREELKREVIEKNLSVRELKKKVAEKKKARNYQGDSKKAIAGAKGAAARAKKIAASKKSDKITIAALFGKYNINMVAKPASLRNLDMSECKPAKKLADQPFGRLQLSNEAALYITWKQTAKGLVSTVTIVREDEPSNE